MLQRFALLGILSVLMLYMFDCRSLALYPGVFKEDFEKGRLDKSRWNETYDGDFTEGAVDVVDIDPSENIDFRLRLRTNTRGTSDGVKYLGVRSKKRVVFENTKAIIFELDWNNQANGSYLTASFYLCPTESNNPKEEDNWLKFEYVGVPPGRNVRIRILERADGAVRPLYADWGSRDEQGRPLGKSLGLSSHRIALILDKYRLRVIQDDDELFPLSKHNLNFTAAYIYLQMSSGTNYPSREVYFDNIIVRSASTDRHLP